MKYVVDMKKLEPSIREIIGAGGKVRLTVTGTSMLPTLAEKRDSVILEKPGKPKKGDIVLYQRTNGEYVLHRIVSVKKESYGICGDNQVDVEFPVGKDQIIAVVSAIMRKGKLIPVTDFAYRCCSFVWTNFIPLRPVMFKTAMKFKNRK